MAPTKKKNPSPPASSTPATEPRRKAAIHQRPPSFLPEFAGGMKKGKRGPHRHRPTSTTCPRGPSRGRKEKKRGRRRNLSPGHPFMAGETLPNAQGEEGRVPPSGLQSLADEEKKGKGGERSRPVASPTGFPGMMDEKKGRAQTRPRRDRPGTYPGPGKEKKRRSPEARTVNCSRTRIERSTSGEPEKKKRKRGEETQRYFPRSLPRAKGGKKGARPRAFRAHTPVRPGSAPEKKKKEKGEGTPACVSYPLKYGENEKKKKERGKRAAPLPKVPLPGPPGFQQSK